MKRPCPDCLRRGRLTLTERSDGRCVDDGRLIARVRNAVYEDPRYRALRARVLRRWVGEHGWWCPGWDVPAHEARDLSLDHTLALADGGAPFDEANAGVLCGSCNSRKSGGRGRYPGGTHTRRADGRYRASGITGATTGAAGTCGVAATAVGAGTKTVVMSRAFNVLNGFLWIPVPEARAVASILATGQGIGFRFTAGPTTLTGWNMTLTYAEV